MGIMDNTAIERIATRQLTSDTLALLEKHGANDDVVSSSAASSGKARWSIACRRS